jgi:DNA-binding response OmpR family regulator
VSRILVITEEEESAVELCARLTDNSFISRFVFDGEDIVGQINSQALDLILLDIENRIRLKELSGRIKQEKQLPIVAVIPRELLANSEGYLDSVDDFVFKPYDFKEVELRIRRLLHEPAKKKSGELITCGDLTIDLARCEVELKGQPVELTFREYELLRFFLNNRGRVHTREGLLNRVWGDDYYGGDRTVDVHIRRLRGKIEDPDHIFIETVRNIGYRFVE